MKREMSVGERIRYFRLVKGFSQEALALEANINTAFVGHLERGLKSPTVNTLEKIVKALGITLEELFSEKITETDKDDQVKALALAKIDYALKGLSNQDIQQLSDIVLEIVRFKLSEHE